MSESLNALKSTILSMWRKLTDSANGKNILIYLLCVCTAAVFWLFLSLDTEVQRDIDVPIALDNVPDSVIIIGNIPPVVNVSVQSKASQLLKFSWGKPSVMKLNYHEYLKRDHVLSISRQKLDARLRDYFGQGVRIVSFRPDSVKIYHTSEPGKRVAVRLDADIQPKLQYTMGDITLSMDSVMVYSTTGIPSDFRSVATERIVKSGLTDTTSFEVKIKAVPGMRIIPDHITVTVPVEPLISKRRNISIEVINQPADIKTITFPSTVEATYLVPMSAFNTDYQIKAYLDYQQIDRKSSYARIKLSAIPGVYRNVTLSADSVEYVIEKRL